VGVASSILAVVQEGAGPRPFDVTTRRLIEEDPAGWLAWVGLPVNGPIRPVESEVSTVLAEVDKLLRIEAASPWLAHLEVQASRDPRLPSRLLQYHALLRHRHDLPIESTIILLRPEADGPELSGRLDLHGATGDLTLSFWFRVVRVWERPVEELLAGGLGVLPLAPLAATSHDQVPDIIRRLEVRFEREAPPATITDLWSATFLLLGLRYDREDARNWLRRIRHMRESSTYQAILDEGRIEGEIRHARQMVLELGADRFGPADSATAARIQRIGDQPILNRLIHGVLRVSSWQELLTLASDR